jgi:integrase/recombinase XerD
MKQQPYALQSAAYKLLLQSFTEWLDVLGYSTLSIPCHVSILKNFLQHQEENNKTSIAEITAADANDFIEKLKNSIGVRIKRPFSNNHINKNINTLKLCSRHLRETGKSSVGFALQLLKTVQAKPVWLTQKEIQQIYDAIKEDVLGIRDKAMMAIYYGCGLRLNEGASIELKDIDFTKKILHVRKGKHYKERFVPIAEKNMQEIKLYIDYARATLLQENKHDFLFVDANRGRKMIKASLYTRLKKLMKRAKIKKQAGTHTLRHSIATHLLQSGMKLEKIKDFLGHAHLDSTQIYTHLVNDKM